MIYEDKDLHAADIQQLSNRDAVASFFLSLGYDVDRIEQTPTSLNITNETLSRQINHIERVASQDDELYIYLFEMKSVRVSDRMALARIFRNRQGEFLLVLTSDYDTLDFVLLERKNPEGAGRRQVAIQLHVLTVTRQNPDAVALRVLRRFSYTEADPYYQFDKLISAYTVAKWSEPLFNNRALFSDYYLNQRLRDSDEWQEKPLPIYNSLSSLLVNVRERLTRHDEALTREQLLEKVFAMLGFNWREGKSSTSDADEPDYILTDGNGNTLAFCLAYKWNRYLDGTVAAEVDPDTPNENPGAKVVSLLAQEDSPPYVIVTNGKLWRLYAKKAHSRATNYYEIDLEEAIASPERELAIRYFWLFFRAEAFIQQESTIAGETRQMCFLDWLMDESANYAKELGDRLKERIFEQIFPHFAEGFIEHIRKTQDEPNAEQLDMVYQGTLTFLYRLMFLLYAESRDLLPVKEVRGYHEISLQQIKREVAEEGGVLLDEAPGKLKFAYRPSQTDLYDRLTRLFSVIDRGNAALNVPNYNGGLFVTDPANGDTSQDAANARFLRDYKIPDRYLAMGLDRLTRDLDPKTKGLVMIDFKSLGVRQLGSIYEGLLEFKLRIAPEKMAIIKGKRTEEIVPYRQAKKGDILATGRGQDKTERTLDKGAVYLENTRQERKATGSYYTPDYIVKYIVEHTVGPVLEEKFAQMTPRLRKAEERYFKAQQNAKQKARAGMTVDDPDKVWNDEAMQQLAVDVLDVKVLDPAMGSGHFLVEVVDFVTDRTLTFLNRFRHNPVRAQLRTVRESILSNMDNQGVNIDADRLTDVNLLKRQVLKRCVYGVDLNHMAVELAKVSLWLDAFTLGAPLSFLDHHLRWGNSLIGTFDLSDVIIPGSERWNQIARAATSMAYIANLSDATGEEVLTSKQTYRSLRADTIPTLEKLNVRVATHFVDLGEIGRTEAYAYLAPAARDNEGSEIKRKFREAQATAEQYRFFHWKLEFPEVFIDLKTTNWKENGGFDAVVGNPPYSSKLSTDTKDLMPLFNLVSFRCDPFAFFIERGLSVARTGGYFGQIIPVTWTGNAYYHDIRRHLFETNSLRELVIFDGLVFDDANVDTSIMIASPHGVTERKFLLSIAKAHSSLKMTTLMKAYDVVELSDRLDIAPIVTRGWDTLMLKMYSHSRKLSKITSHISLGLRVASVDKDTNSLQNKQFPDALFLGNNIERYEPLSPRLFFNAAEVSIVGGTKNPTVYSSQPKILLQSIRNLVLQRRIVPTLDTTGVHFGGNVVGIILENDEQYAIEFLLAILASNLLNSFFAKRFVTISLTSTFLSEIPIRRIDFTTPHNERAHYRDELIALYMESNRQKGEPRDLLEQVQWHLDGNQTDVIHDLLAFLAQTMIDLNKSKQEEIKRFLAWLEGQIGANIDDLSGKTIIRGYLGDYQKNQPETPFEDVFDQLRKGGNSKHISANLGDTRLQARLREEYEKSLAVLLPMKQQLATTDWLIDQIVYQLYSLTEEEIAIVEGRA